MRFMNVFVMRLLSICILAHLLSALPAGAQLVQVPNLPEFGNSNNKFPFSPHSFPMRYQQIYASSAFPHGGIIDKIKFRHDQGEGMFNTYEVEIDIQVAFAYAATTVDTPSPVFDYNIGNDFTIVFDGTTFQSHQGAPPTLDFKFILDVANTFTYDPSRGDLLMQVLVRDPSADFTVFDASGSPQQNVTTRIWSLGTDATIGTIGLPCCPMGPYGLVTQFEFIPEPSSIAQLGAMLLLMIAHRRRHE